MLCRQIPSVKKNQHVRFKLLQNYPNPFNPTTTIHYNLYENTLVNIVIYDLNGNKVKNLVSDYQNVGQKVIQWDAKNDQNHLVAAGVYFYNFQAGGYSQTKKMLLLK